MRGKTSEKKLVDFAAFTFDSFRIETYRSSQARDLYGDLCLIDRYGKALVYEDRYFPTLVRFPERSSDFHSKRMIGVRFCRSKGLSDQKIYVVLEQSYFQSIKD